MSELVDSTMILETTVIISFALIYEKQKFIKTSLRILFFDFIKNDYIFAIRYLYFV